MKLFNYKKNKGFSLIETLIAVSILMIAITGPLTLVQAGLFSSNHERNQITAIYLAQEAMEFIRSVRDNNSYQNVYNTKNSIPLVDWLYDSADADSLLNLCGGAGAGSNGCYVDPFQKLSGKFIEPVGVGADKPLYQHNDLNTPPALLNTPPALLRYDHDSGSGIKTSFVRKVKITQVNSNEVTVSVTVGWKDNLLARTYTINENLLDYEQNGN